MGKKVRSARGEMVDLDLLKIREQISSNPIPLDVQARQDFVEKRQRRRLKKVPPPAPAIKGEAAAPTMPGTEELSEEPTLHEQDTPTTRSRQKARPPKKQEPDNTEE